MGVPSGPLSKGFPKSLGSLWGMAVTGRETRPSQDSLMEAPGCGDTRLPHTQHPRCLL